MSIFSRCSIKLVLAGVVVLNFSLLTACSQQETSAANLRLPISINEVMASLINHSADPIWVAAWRNLQSDTEWRELEHLAKQLEIGGALLSISGTGPMDEQWTSNADWRNFATQLSQAAGRAANAARSRDVQLVAKSGDEIVDICEACHLVYKPDLPTMNIYGELSPRP
jgi:hypothetical protein